MPKFTDKRKIADELKKFGYESKHADDLAAEQAERGLPHLEMQCFLRIVHSCMRGLENPEQLVNLVNSVPPEELNEKRYAFERSAKRMLDLGVAPPDILVVIQEMQYVLLEQLFSVLDSVSDLSEFPISEFQVYANDEETFEPDVLIDGLHECMYAMREWD